MGVFTHLACKQHQRVCTQICTQIYVPVWTGPNGPPHALLLFCEKQAFDVILQKERLHVAKQMVNAIYLEHWRFFSGACFPAKVLVFSSYLFCEFSQDLPCARGSRQMFCLFCWLKQLALGSLHFRPFVMEVKPVNTWVSQVFLFHSSPSQL